jgi:hypothetical protein
MPSLRAGSEVKLAIRAQYATLSPEFDDFLFAPIGEERNGMSLSVMSAFSRLNIDPWQEAAQLSDLSKEKAVEALAPILARLPAGRWAAVDIPAIARRLVEILPRHEIVTKTVTTMRVRGKVPARAIYILLLAVCAMVYFGFIAHHQPPVSSDAAPPAMSDAPH